MANPYQYTGSGQGFLTDYSGLAAAGSAFDAFSKSYGDAQDKQLKRQETQAQIDAIKTKQQREKEQSAIEAWKSRTSLTTAADGSVSVSESGRPQTDQEKLETSGKLFNEGGMQDPNDPTKVIFNPESAKAKEIAAHRLASQATADQKTNNDWEKAATLINNPSSRTQIGRYSQMLDRANTVKQLSNQLGMGEGQSPPKNETREQMIKRFDEADPRQLYEIATAMDTMVKNGQATVYGADHLMPKNMELSAAKMQEFMPTWAAGSKPKAANAGEYIARYLDSVNREKGYFENAREGSVGGLKAGFSHLKNKDINRWNEMFKNVSPDAGSQPVQQQTQAAPQPAAPQGGLVQPSLMQRLSGMINVDSAQAAPTPQVDAATAAKIKRLEELKAKAGH